MGRAIAFLAGLTLCATSAWAGCSPLADNLHEAAAVAKRHTDLHSDMQPLAWTLTLSAKLVAETEGTCAEFQEATTGQIEALARLAPAIAKRNAADGQRLRAIAARWRRHR